MKVIDLSRRTMFVNDIVSIYNEYKCGEFSHYTNYYIETKHGRISVDECDYKKVKEYLLSLNDEVEVIEDTSNKIKHINLANVPEEKRWFAFIDKINEIIDKINGGN